MRNIKEFDNKYEQGVHLHKFSYHAKDQNMINIYIRLINRRVREVYNLIEQLNETYKNRQGYKSKKEI